VKKEAPLIIVICDSLLSTSTCIDIKDSTNTLKRNFVYLCEGSQLVRSRALNQRILKKLCQEMGAQHEIFLHHTEVRWFSRGQVLKRLVELRKEVGLFNRKTRSSLSALWQ